MKPAEIDYFNENKYFPEICIKKEQKAKTSDVISKDCIHKTCTKYVF